MRQVLDSCNLFTTFLEGILYRKSDDTKGACKIPSLFEFLAVQRIIQFRSQPVPGPSCLKKVDKHYYYPVNNKIDFPRFNFICRIVIYVVYSALQDLNNQSQVFRNRSIEKIKQVKKRGGLGSSGKGKVPLLPSPVSSHLLLLMLLFFFFRLGGGGEVGLLYELPALHYLNAQNRLSGRRNYVVTYNYCKSPVPILIQKSKADQICS